MTQADLFLNPARLRPFFDQRGSPSKAGPAGGSGRAYRKALFDMCLLSSQAGYAENVTEEALRVAWLLTLV